MTITGPLVSRTSIIVARRIICPWLFRTWSWQDLVDPVAEAAGRPGRSPARCGRTR